MKRYFTLLYLFVHLITNAQTIVPISANASSTEPIAPRRTIENIENGVIVTYYFDNALVFQDPLYPECSMWNYLGFAEINISGRPAIPISWDYFTSQKNADIDVCVIDSSYITINTQLSPARQPLIDSSTDVYSTTNVLPIIPYDGFYPLSVLSINQDNDYRGTPILGIATSPIQYNYEDQYIKAYTMIKYKISYAENNLRRQINSPIESINLADLYTDTKHPSSRSSSTITTRELLEREYLILTNNTLQSEAARFAEWKRTLGFNVHVVAKSTWTEQAARDTILYYYNNPGTLHYLMIFGDETVVPPKELGGQITDRPYFCMGDSRDGTPDFSHGRIPVNTIAEAKIVVDKMISFEKNPSTDQAFYQTGVHHAYFQDDSIADGMANRRFVQTSEDILLNLQQHGKTIKRVYYTESYVDPTKWSNYYGGGGPVPSYLRRPNFAWNGDVFEMMEHVLDGAFYLLRRGHGVAEGWEPPFFRTYHVNALTNGNKLPVIFSICCSSGEYDKVGYDCFVEECLENPNGGGIAVIAATEASYSGYSDLLTIGMFDAIWPTPSLRPNFTRFANISRLPERSTPSYELGSILNIGKMSVYSVMGYDGTSRSTNEFFHLFGDPSMQMYTECPVEIAKPHVYRVDSTIFVELTDGDATISFYDPVTKVVKAFYGNSASIQSSANINISISRHNCIPYLMNDASGTIYIQNETINDNRSYTADTIRVGYDVTDKKMNGDVIFNANQTRMTAKKVSLRDNVRVPKGKRLNIRNF